SSEWSSPANGWSPLQLRQRHPPSSQSCKETNMKRFDQLVVAAATCVIALFLLAQPATAQSGRLASESESKAQHKGEARTHRLILQVNNNDPAMMNLALNNTANVDQYYSDLGEPVEIEVVTFGPGLHMLR